MIPKAIVPTRKEINAACIGLLKAKLSYELTPICEAKEQPIKTLNAIRKYDPKLLNEQVSSVKVPNTFPTNG